VTDDRLEQIVGNLLRAGVMLSGGVVLAGGAWYLAAHAGSMPRYHTFRPDVRGMHALFQLPTPLAVILAGLLILVATPVARVVFALVAFGLERDRVYVAVTAIVLAILLYSLVTGL
jgi:uncharacterized membrane protein